MLPQPTNKGVSLKLQLHPVYVPAGGLTYRSLSDFFRSINTAKKKKKKNTITSDWSCRHIWISNHKLPSKEWKLIPNGQNGNIFQTEWRRRPNSQTILVGNKHFLSFFFKSPDRLNCSSRLMTHRTLSCSRCKPSNKAPRFGRDGSTLGQLKML